MWFHRSMPSLARTLPVVRTVVESVLESSPSPVERKTRKEKLPCRVRARCALWGSLVILLVSMCSLSFEPWSSSQLDASTASPIGKILCIHNSSSSYANDTQTNEADCPFQNWSNSDPIACRLAWFLYSIGLLMVGASVAWRLYARTPQQMLSRRRWQTAVHIILLGFTSTYVSLILWATHCNSCWLAPTSNSSLTNIWFFLISTQSCLLMGALGSEIELCYEIRKHNQLKLRQPRKRVKHWKPPV